MRLTWISYGTSGRAYESPSFGGRIHVQGAAWTTASAAEGVELLMRGRCALGGTRRGQSSRGRHAARSVHAATA
eukprot:388079-Rhodomonas_salina.3